MYLLIILTFLINVSSFTVPPASSGLRTANNLQSQERNTNVVRRTATLIFSSTRDEEIAELEAKLRELRENDVNMQSNTEGKDYIDPDDEKTLREFEAARRRLEKVKGKDMLLTEQTLIQGGLMENSDSNAFGIFPLIAASLIALVGLFFFAQVPIGQEDLARYSATGSSSIKTIDLGDINPDTSRQ